MSCNNYRKCVKCKKTRAEDMTVSYHRFPTPGENNITKACAWAKFCWPEQDFDWDQLQALHNSSKVLCGRHFDSADFYDDRRQKLSKYAIPAKCKKQLMGNKENVCIMGINPSKKQLSSGVVALSDITNINVGLSTPPSRHGLSHRQAQSEPPVLSVLTDNIQNINAPKQQFSPSTVALSDMINVGPSIQPSTSGLSHGQALSEPPVLSVLTDNIQNITKVTTAKRTERKRSSGILTKLNVSKLSELSPREKKLYNICRNKMREINRLRKRMKNQTGILSPKTVSEADSVKKLLNLNLSSSFILLLQSQLKNCPKKPKGRRYSLEEKIMSLGIYKKSAACYRLLRRMFALPCQSSLNKLLNAVPLHPGINKHIFATLKTMAEKQLEEDNICILSFDEMAIRKHVWYDPKIDHINGFQDHGNHGRSNQFATKALVFMLTGLRKKWKQPIAYYLSHTLNADRMTVIVKEILTECHSAKMNVVATVCDLSTVNMKVLKTLGATTQEPFFSHCGKEIVAILDPPHLLKCTRNLFMKYNVECITDIQSDGKTLKGTARWRDIVDFYNIDKNNLNFIFAPALTDQHCNPNLKQQMRVKLAAQVFSHSVAAGILAKCATSELPPSAVTTATFVTKFDQLFDAVNADTPDRRRGKLHSTNLTKQSPHLKLFIEMRHFISNMKYLGSNNKPPSQDGWIHTLNAIERLWKNLNKKIDSIETRRLNQDPLENFFGCIRYSCGSNNNPTINQFVAGVKTAIVTNLRHSGRKKNCEDDTLSLANNFKSFLLADCPSVENVETNEPFNYLELESIIADAVENVDQATPESQACGYVSGFIFKKLKFSECPECRKAFLTESKEAVHIFTTFKEYAPSDSLMYVSKNVILCVEIMATIINKFLDTEAWRSNLKKSIMAKFASVDFNFLNICEKHCEVNKFHLKRSVFFICIKRCCGLKNREIEELEKHKALERKLNILKNK